jgi:serine O-acetyltransferase
LTSFIELPIENNVWEASMGNYMVGKIFNISRRLYLNKVPAIPKILWAFNRIVFSCDIPCTADVHPTVLFIHNGLGVVIHKKSKIGKNTTILHHVTIGGNMGKKAIYEGKEITYPIIGEGVFVGVGACILGPVIIGNHAQIGAGSIVLSDVPDYALAVGSPAKVVKILNPDGSCN